jgi:hypothetical protein
LKTEREREAGRPVSILTIKSNRRILSRFLRNSKARLGAACSTGEWNNDKRRDELRKERAKKSLPLDSSVRFGSRQFYPPYIPLHGLNMVT